MHSAVDIKGNLSVDCSECERGGNGTAKDKCSCGWKTKRPKHGACYIGDLMEKYLDEARKKIEAVKNPGTRTGFRTG